MMKLSIPQVIWSTVIIWGGLSLQAKDAMEIATPIEADAPYEAGRGLLTIQRPSGVVINPTSATLPEHAFTAQYCFFLPNNDSKPWMTHGAMIAYGVTDWLEVAGLFAARTEEVVDDYLSGGVLVRARILKDEGFVPQFSVGYYSFHGDIENYNAFAAIYKRCPIGDESGFVKSVGFHAGIRETWIEDGPAVDKSDRPVGYVAVEIQLPARFYLVGEVSTDDKDLGDRTPYGFGVQWRAGGINITTAFTEVGANGITEPSFFFGIGTQYTF
jgi:hypothetical protein